MRSMRLLALLLLVLLPLALSGCGGGGGGGSTGATPATTGSEPTPGPGLATIRGYVTDPASRLPVAGAVVTLSSGDGVFAAPVARGAAVRRSISRAPITSTVTDERGYYEFAKIPAGDYGVTVSKDGKTGAFFVARATSDTFVDGTIELTPVVTLAGQVAVPILPRGNDDFPPLVWLSGTSFGAFCKPEPSLTTATHLIYSFAISGVPVRANTTYSVAYYADDAVNRVRTLVFTNLSTVTFDNAALTVSNFQVALGRTELTADPYASNRPPTVVVSGPSGPVQTGTAVTLDASGSSDPDGHSFTLMWIQTAGYPVNLAGSGTTRSFTPTRAGIYTFMVMAVDLFGAQSAPATVTVEVVDGAGVAVNRPPSAGVGPAEQTGTVGTAVALQGSGGDPDPGSTLSFRWIQLSGPSVTLDVTSPSAVLSDASFTPALPGTYVFALVVSDGQLSSPPAFATVTVQGTGPVNHPPVANAGADQMAVAIDSTVTLVGSGTDPDAGTTLSFRWAQVLGTPVTLSAPGSASTSFPASVPGLYVFSLTVSDGALAATDYVQVLVADPANAQPVAYAGSDFTVNISGGPVTAALDGTGSADPDNDPLTYSWLQTGGPPVTLSDYAAAQPSFVANTPGILYFSLLVSDGYQLSEPSFVRVSVIGSSVGAPTATLTADDPAPLVGATVTLTATATPGSPASTFRFVQVLGPPVALAGADGTRTFVPADPGGYLFMVTADNGHAVSIPAYAEVRVSTPENDTPIANAGTDQFAIAVGTSVTLDGSLSSDADGPNALTHRWTQTLGPAVSLIGAGTATASFEPLHPGVYEFQLEVSDGAASATSRVRVAVNHPPVAKITPFPADLLLGQSLTLNALDSFDPDQGPAMPTYNWSVGMIPPGATASFNNPTADMPVFSATHAGLYRIYLTVHDGAQSSAPAEAEIRVVIPTPDVLEITVAQNPKGTPDTISGQSGSVPANAALLVSATNAPPYEMITTNFADGSGAFSFAIGDNDPRIRKDEIFLAITDPSGTPGPFVRLVNDVTPPAQVAPIPAAPPAPIHAGHYAAYHVNGSTEANCIVEVVLALNPGAQLSRTVNSDMAGRFNAQFDTTALPDAAGYSLYARATDAAGNRSEFILLAAGIVKDTVPPAVTNFLPANNAQVRGAEVPVSYSLSEAVDKVEIAITRTGGSPDGALRTLLPPSAALGRGDHKFMAFPDPPLVHGAIYSFTVNALDRGGNWAAPVMITGVTCDTAPPTGITVTAPAASGSILAADPRVGFDTSGANEPLSRIRVKALSPNDPRAPIAWETTDSGLLMPSAHANVPVGFPVDLLAGVVYDIVLEFVDLAGNVQAIPRNGVTAVASSGGGTIVVDRPKANGKVAGIPMVTYTLSEDFASGQVEFVWVAGDGAPQPPQMASLDITDLTAGAHGDVMLSTVSLADNDVFTVRFRGTTVAGVQVGPVEIPNVTADSTPPAIASATVLQRTFGVWSPGDQIVMVFNEPMDAAYNMPFSGGPLGFLDMFDGQPGGTDGFTFHDALVWSADRSALTVTFADPSFVDSLDVRADLTRFQADLRDEAGNPLVWDPYNSNDPATYFTFSPAGDTVAPALELLKPQANSFVGASPVVEYRTNERLATGELRFELVVGVDPLAPRTYPLVGAQLDPTPPGTKTVVNTAMSGLSLVQGAVYRLVFSGQDGAGNAAQAVAQHLTVDTNPPGAAPAGANFAFHNYNGNLVSKTGSNGVSGEYICVRFGPEGQPVYESLLSAPYEMNQIVISGIAGAPVPQGTTVWLAWKDQAGNRTAFVADGSIPAPLLDADRAQLGLRVDTTSYKVDAVTINSPGDRIWVNFDRNGIAFKAGTYIQGSSYAADPNAVPQPAVQPGRSVFYIVEDGLNGEHLSDYSINPDGQLVFLDQALPFDSGSSPGAFGNGDGIELFFRTTSGGANVAVHVPALISSGSFKFGLNTASPGFPYFDTPPIDFNLTAWSNVSSGQVITTFTGGSPQINPPGDTSITLTFPTFAATASADRLSFDLHPLGTNLILGPGDHCVLPSATPITGPNSGGIELLRSAF